VFLDRDGTINEDTDYPHKPSELALIPNTLHGLKILAHLQAHIIVVSNQAGIALGYFKESDLIQFNEALRERVSDAGGRIDAFYFCPELDDESLPKDHERAWCCKPSPGMLIEAAADFGLSLGGSFMVGDKNSDVGAGLAAGCTTILLRTGKAGSDPIRNLAQPNHECANLLEAARLIETLIPASVGSPGLKRI
jgi:D-glycero-D-manno-heptose 1,7-bisphosphate phosphatase